MQRRIVHHFIVHAFKVDAVICLVTYLLLPLNERFIWIFAGSLVVLVWLFVAGLFSLLELLLYGDDLNEVLC